MARLQKLGVATPDPSVQRNVLTHYVFKLAEANKEFEYRLNAYTMNRHLTGAVTQEQVDELWRYLVSEAREFHRSTVKDSVRKAKTANSSSGRISRMATFRKERAVLQAAKSRRRSRATARRAQARAAAKGQERSSKRVQAQERAKAKLQTTCRKIRVAMLEVQGPARAR